MPGTRGDDVTSPQQAMRSPVRDRAAAVVRRWCSAAGLVALMVLLICVPIELGAGAFPADGVSGLVVMAAAVMAWRDGQRLAPATAVLIGAVVLGVSVVALSGSNLADSAEAWARYLQLFALVPLGVVLALRDRRDVVLVLHALVLAALIQGVVCVYQFGTGTGATFQGQNSRATGTFGGEDVIAASVILGLAVTVCAALAISATGRRRLVYVVLALGLLVPLGLTFSRGSALTTAFALLIVLAFAGWRTLVATLVCAMAAAVVLVGAGLDGGAVGERLLSIGESDSSTGDRMALWAAAVGIWVDNPVNGVGLREFPRYRDTYAPPGLSGGSTVGQSGPGGALSQQELLSPHNQYLLVLSEQGIIGFLPFAALLFVSTATAWRATLRGPRYARGTGAAVVGISMWQLFNFLYGDLGGATSLSTAVILGLALWYGLEQPSNRDDPSSVVDPDGRTSAVRLAR